MKRILFIITVSAIVFTACIFAPSEVLPHSNPDDPFNPETTVRIFYDANGAESGSVPSDLVFYQKDELAIVLDNNGNLEKSGYYFMGWNTAASGEGSIYEPGTGLTIGADDITLYANWMQPGSRQDFSINGISFSMMYVPGGYSFPRDMDDGGIGTIDNSFQTAETEVTYELWSAVYDWAVNGGGAAVGEGEYNFQNPGRQGGDSIDNEPVGTIQHPVSIVNWRDAIIWCNALTEWCNAVNNTAYICAYKDFGEPIRDSSDGNAAICDGVILDSEATGFRLLGDSEWEFAARWRNNSTNTVAGYDNPWFTKGDSCSGAIDPANAGSSQVSVLGNNTEAVKTKSKNGLGIYDMSGNVAEWIGSVGQTRGGGWRDPSVTYSHHEIGDHETFTADYTSDWTGFRFCKNAE